MRGAALLFLSLVVATAACERAAEMDGARPAADVAELDAAVWLAPAASGDEEEGADYLREVRAFSLPEWVLAAAGRDGFDARVVPAYRLNPFYQSGDFDGDGTLDLALLVRSRAGGELGILLLHGGGWPGVLLGAGEEFGNGGSDFGWLTNWRVRPRRPGGGADALELIKLESASALVERSGSGYRWRQLGD